MKKVNLFFMGAVISLKDSSKRNLKIAQAVGIAVLVAFATFWIDWYFMRLNSHVCTKVGYYPVGYVFIFSILFSSGFIFIHLFKNVKFFSKVKSIELGKYKWIALILFFLWYPVFLIVYLTKDLAEAWYEDNASYLIYILSTMFAAAGSLLRAWGYNQYKEAAVTIIILIAVWYFLKDKVPRKLKIIIGVTLFLLIFTFNFGF